MISIDLNLSVKSETGCPAMYSIYAETRKAGKLCYGYATSWKHNILDCLKGYIEAALEFGEAMDFFDVKEQLAKMFPSYKKNIYSM